MNVEGLLVWDVQKVQPTTEALATAVSIERSWDSLMAEPLVGMTWNVADVLAVAGLTGEPFLVDFERFSLDSFQKLHTGNGTDSVPVGFLDWIPVLIQNQILRW